MQRITVQSADGFILCGRSDAPEDPKAAVVIVTACASTMDATNTWSRS